MEDEKDSPFNAPPPLLITAGIGWVYFKLQMFAVLCALLIMSPIDLCVSTILRCGNCKQDCKKEPITLRVLQHNITKLKATKSLGP